MTEHLGRTASILISTSGVDPFTVICEAKDLSSSLSTEQLDATSRCDGGYKVKVNGDQEMTIDIELNYDPSDGGQEILLAAAKARTTLYCQYRKQGTGAGLPQRACQVNIETEDDDAPTSDIHSASYSLVSTGTITDSLQ